jgi:hypothetical protein
MVTEVDEWIGYGLAEDKSGAGDDTDKGGTGNA